MKELKRIFLLFALLLVPGNAVPAAGTDPGDDPGADRVGEAVRRQVEERGREVLGELAALVAIPNLASDTDNIRANADFLVEALRRRGIATRRLEVEGSPPVIVGDLETPGAEHTLVLYFHYDGQPADPDEWRSHPWRPEVRDPRAGKGAPPIDWRRNGVALDDEWRLYGRSASDDKAPIVAMLAALDALRAAGIPPSVNLKFFLEGEEEVGSPHLAEVLQSFGHLLDADLWLMCDGPIHQTRRMQIFFGARGVIGLEMKVYGPLRPLHSGHYGNWAPNPIAMLARLIASMRGDEGEIRIDGFSDQVRRLTRAERDALAKIPDRRDGLMEELALGRTEGEGAQIEALIMRPAINLRGFVGGGVEELSRNAIATEARASIDFRLVPDQTPAFVRDRVEAHIRARGYEIVREEPDPATRRAHPKLIRLEWDHGYPPARAPMDLPVSRGLVRVVEAAVGTPIVELPTLGGSGPLYLFFQALDTPAVGVPIVNHDNNQHARDENLRLGNLWAGIGVYAAILARLGHHWETAPR